MALDLNSTNLGASSLLEAAALTSASGSEAQGSSVLPGSSVTTASSALSGDQAVSGLAREFAAAKTSLGDSCLMYELALARLKLGSSYNAQAKDYQATVTDAGKQASALNYLMTMVRQNEFPGNFNVVDVSATQKRVAAALSEVKTALAQIEQGTNYTSAELEDAQDLYKSMTKGAYSVKGDTPQDFIKSSIKYEGSLQSTLDSFAETSGFTVDKTSKKCYKRFLGSWDGGAKDKTVSYNPARITKTQLADAQQKLESYKATLSYAQTLDKMGLSISNYQPIANLNSSDSDKRSLAEAQRNKREVELDDKLSAVNDSISINLAYMQDMMSKSSSSFDKANQYLEKHQSLISDLVRHTAQR